MLWIKCINDIEIENSNINIINLEKEIEKSNELIEKFYQLDYYWVTKFLSSSTIRYLSSRKTTECINPNSCECPDGFHYGNLGDAYGNWEANCCNDEECRKVEICEPKTCEINEWYEGKCELWV